MEAEKNIELFVKHGIFTAAEVRSRVEIMLEKYAKTINIEALTMLDMLYKDILPDVYKRQVNSLLDDHLKANPEGCQGHDHFHNLTPESEWKTCLAHAEKLGMGTRAYELVTVK